MEENFPAQIFYRHPQQHEEAEHPLLVEEMPLDLGEDLLVERQGGDDDDSLVRAVVVEDRGIVVSERPLQRLEPPHLLRRARMKDRGLPSISLGGRRLRPSSSFLVHGISLCRVRHLWVRERADGAAS